MTTSSKLTRSGAASLQPGSQPATCRGSPRSLLSFFPIGSASSQGSWGCPASPPSMVLLPPSTQAGAQLPVPGARLLECRAGAPVPVMPV